MKFTFLGTASCEGIPALFCNCPRCAAARALGGKNIRTRAQALIDDDILIDLPPDTLYHFQTRGIEGHKLRHLLVTHSHSDHLAPKELHNRGPGRCSNMEIDVLHVWCSKGSYDAITATAPCEDYVKIHLVKPFEPFTVGKYQVTALPANHHKGDEAVIYLIVGEKTVLYAHDTHYFHDDVWAYFKEQGVHFDMVSLDCTKGIDREADYIGHMGAETNLRTRERLIACGAADEHTVFVANHFSHNGYAPIPELEKAMPGFVVSYDGLVLETRK